jgi:hypothetical protein
MEQGSAEALAAKLAGGHWTHDYALTASEAQTLGLPVKVGMPSEVMELMKLYSTANSAVRRRISALRDRTAAASLMASPSGGKLDPR